MGSERGEREVAGEKGKAARERAVLKLFEIEAVVVGERS